MFGLVETAGTNQWVNLRVQSQEQYGAMRRSKSVEDLHQRRNSDTNVDTLDQISIISLRSVNQSGGGSFRIENADKKKNDCGPLTFLTMHLQNMYSAGTSPTTVKPELETKWGKRLHKIAFICTGAASVMHSASEIKYYAIQIAMDGNLRNGIDLCYRILRLILRGKIIYKLSIASDEIREFATKLDTVAEQKLGISKDKIQWISAGVMIYCAFHPVLFMLYALAKMDWDLEKFLLVRGGVAIEGLMVWSAEGENHYDEYLSDLSWSAKITGGLLFAVNQCLGQFQELLTKQLLTTAAITLDRMAGSFRSELQTASKSVTFDPSDTPDVGFISGTLWDKYIGLKKASGMTNEKFGQVFNIIHILFLLQCAYLLHKLLNKEMGPDVPFLFIGILMAIVVYHLMAKTAEVTSEFRDWIHEHYEPCKRLKIPGRANWGISMPVLLDQLGTNKIGLRGGAGVVTIAFNIACAQVAIQYFLILWGVDDEVDCNCVCPDPNADRNGTLPFAKSARSLSTVETPLLMGMEDEIWMNWM